METHTTVGTPGDEPEEKPRAHGIPTVREGDIEVLEFEWRGEIHVVEIRKPSWGRAREIQKGMRLREYEETDPSTGETRVVKEYDASDLTRAGAAMFEAYVVSVNGVPWTRAQSVDALDPEWFTTFLQVIQPRIGTGVDAARKKSSGP